MNDNEKNCKEIKDFLRENIHDISESDLRFLLGYYGNLRKSSSIVSPTITDKTILEDLKKLIDEIPNGELTPLSLERLTLIQSLFNQLLSGGSLDDISAEIDRLFVGSDLGAREHSKLIYTLKSDKEGK